MHSRLHFIHISFHSSSSFTTNMDKFQACGQLVGNCALCISRDCMYVQFLSGHWSCVDQLSGWRDIVRVIAPNFPETCESLATLVGDIGDVISTNRKQLPMISGDMFWIILLGIVQVATIFLMTIGFWVLFSRDQRLIRAIESIPAQIREVYRQQHHQFNRIRRQNHNAVFSDDEDDDDHEANANINAQNPFLPMNNIVAPPPPPHQQIEMEIQGGENEEDFSSSEDDSPEVLPAEGFMTRFGRIIRRPNFFRL